MIEPTDEMVQLALDIFLATPTDTIAQIDEGMGKALAAVLAIAERQWQEAYGDAYQAGWWRGQHRLCPRCGVELERDVAKELAERGPAEARAALDVALADALPISGGRVRKRLKQLLRELAELDEQRKPCSRPDCGHTKAWHRDGRCAGDLMHCKCEGWQP